ncbi:hypothetical protein [Dyadobacter sp. CY356]|uniref:hypothetical protein n=1 Tax=Dyadobacter sp. CY356 TaxID=2906442 RepID=UPI001F43535D|nr:hypothetical protein [Dyadobacter sp. CY356]MCF0054606.1 hypothetical protein [Dyadobacter sp. CY356]
MRSFLAYLLLFSVMMPTISPWGTIAYFRLNRENIARTLCENRERPLAMCYGRCYLAKVLKQQKEQEDKETAQRLQNLPLYQLFTQAEIQFAFISKDFFQIVKACFSYQLVWYTAPGSCLLRPPKFS